MEAPERLFEPIEAESVSDAIVSQVERLIISGVLKSEMKMPSERELSELFQISRPKVRDAVKELERRGLLTSRHGDGTFVAELTGAALSPAMVELFARHPEAFADYLEFRRELEGYAAFLAAERATSSDHAVIETLLTEMVAAHADEDPTREGEIDVALHVAVVDAAHNSMMSHVMASMYGLMSKGVFYNRDFLYRTQRARDQLLEQHKAIGEGVLSGDPERAATAAEEHLDFVCDAMFANANAERRERIARKRLRLMERNPNARAKRPRPS